MKSRSFMIVLLLVLPTAAVRADSFWHDCWKSLSKPFCCPDDYCPKPMPPVACQAKLGCDDYCKKPLPPKYHPAPLGCDDYHQKPWNICPCVGSGPWYICGPGKCCESK